MGDGLLGPDLQIFGQGALKIYELPDAFTNRYNRARRLVEVLFESLTVGGEALLRVRIGTQIPPHLALEALRLLDTVAVW